MIIILVYVDDLTMICSDMSILNNVKAAFMKRFEMVDEGEIKKVLKIKIDRDRPNKKLMMSQKKYIVDILTRFDMMDCKVAVTPMISYLHLEPTKLTKEEIKAQPYPYPSLVGSLIHLARYTRPDISFAVRYLSKFMSCYDEIHWNAAQRVLKYLKGTSGHGLVYCCDSLNEIIYQMYADASFGNRDEGRRSVSGYLSTMG